jgi:hypothetical protein
MLKMRGLIPSAVKMSVTNNQSNKTRDMVSDLENSIIFGVLLVVFVLAFLLGLAKCLVCGCSHSLIDVDVFYDSRHYGGFAQRNGALLFGFGFGDVG